MNVGNRVQALRKRSGLTQEAVAERAGIDVKQLGKIEHDKSRPRKSTQVRLSKALSCELSDITGDVSDVADHGSIRVSTLRQFPLGFAPLVIVVGDRREDPPKTIGDLLAFAGSPCDLACVFGLDVRGDTEIVSDKVFAQGDDEYLRLRFGNKHLIAVGSPATNYLSRKINQSAVFRFHLDDNVQSLLSSFEREVRNAWLGYGRAGLQQFAKDGARRRRIKEALMTCRNKGYVDPTSEGTFTRGAFQHQDDDWGVVSLAEHPYRDSGDVARVAVLVGGVHLPATMFGLMCLASRPGSVGEKPASWFKKRPYGGIFRIFLDDAKWEDKLRERAPKWSTSEYEDAQGLASHFNEMLQTKQKLLPGASIGQVKAFLQHLDATVPKSAARV